MSAFIVASLGNLPTRPSLAFQILSRSSCLRQKACLRHTLHQPQTHTKSGLAIFLARALRPPRMRVAKPTITLNITENRHHHQIRYARSIRWRYGNILSLPSVAVDGKSRVVFQKERISRFSLARSLQLEHSGEIRESDCRTLEGKMGKTQADEGGQGGSNAVAEGKKLTTK